MYPPKKSFSIYSQGAVAVGLPEPDFQRDRAQVLVVDDEELVLKLISTIFSRLGFEVTEAQNGNCAIGLIEENPFDLVVTDYKMPGMDGLSLASEIKNRFSSLPVILTSGNLVENLMDLDGYGHVDAFIQKTD